MHIRSLEMKIQELAKQPILDHSLGLQALHDELFSVKNALQEACQGTSPVIFPYVSTPKADNANISSG